MAKQVVEFQTRADQTVQVEVEAVDGGTVLAGGRTLVTKAQKRFEEAISVIHPITESVIASLRDLAHAPAEVCVEFGIKLSAKADVIIASTDAEANFKISLTWKPVSEKA